MNIIILLWILIGFLSWVVFINKNNGLKRIDKIDELVNRIFLGPVVFLKYILNLFADNNLSLKDWLNK